MSIRLITMIALTGHLLSGCGMPSKPIPKFTEGQVVQHKVTKQKGLIVFVRCPLGEKQCYYWTRFNAWEELTDTLEFELEPAQEELCKP